MTTTHFALDWITMKQRFSVCLAPAPAETPPSLSSNKNKSSPGLASSWAVSSKNWPCLPPTAAARQPSGAVIVTQSLDDNPKIITIWGF